MIEHNRQTKALAVFFLRHFNLHAPLILLNTASDITKPNTMMLFILLSGAGNFTLLIPIQLSDKIIFYLDNVQTFTMPPPLA